MRQESFGYDTEYSDKAPENTGYRPERSDKTSKSSGQASEASGFDRPLSSINLQYHIFRYIP